MMEAPTERRGPTASEGPEHGPVLDAQPRMPGQEALTLGVEDIGHLNGGPRHAYDRRKRRDRGTVAGIGTCSCSNGFGAACR